MNFKHYCSAALLSLFGIAFGAETILAQGLFVRGGLSISTYSSEELSSANETLDVKSRIGYHLGAMIEFPLTGIFTIETGALLNAKGAKADYVFSDPLTGAPSRTETVTSSLHIDVPINVKATLEITDELRIFGMAGPYLGLGLSGSVNKTEVAGGATESTEGDIEWGNDGFNRFDYGVNFGVGVEYDNVHLFVSRYMGLRSIAEVADGTSSKHRLFHLSLGYRIL